jgi:hypothetical protein
MGTVMVLGAWDTVFTELVLGTWLIVVQTYDIHTAATEHNGAQSLFRLPVDSLRVGRALELPYRLGGYG